MRREPSVIAAGLALALAASFAAAQPGPGPGPPRDRPSEADFAARRQEVQAQRARDLAIVLRLRPDQLPALAAFLDADRPPQPPAPGDRPPSESLTTPQRLDHMARRQDEREALMRRRDEALRAFYAALNPDQQAAFDALQRLQGPPHGFGRFGGPPGPEGPGPR